jgi:hypothetical protein
MYAVLLKATITEIVTYILHACNRLRNYRNASHEAYKSVLLVDPVCVQLLRSATICCFGVSGAARRLSQYDGTTPYCKSLRAAPLTPKQQMVAERKTPGHLPERQGYNTPSSSCPNVDGRQPRRDRAARSVHVVRETTLDKHAQIFAQLTHPPYPCRLLLRRDEPETTYPSRPKRSYT